MSNESEQSGLTFPDAYVKGTLLLHRGDLEGARQSFETAREEVRGSKDPRLLTAVLGNLGNVYAALDEKEKARSLYREVLEHQRKDPDARIAGRTLVNLGNLSRELGEAERSRAYYLEAESLLQSVRDDFSLGSLYANLGLLEMDGRRPGEAVLFLKRAIELHKKTGNEEGLAATWGQLGRAYRQLGKDQRAETCFNYSYTHFGQVGKPEGEAEALRGLADIYEDRNEPELALRCLTRIREIFTRFSLRLPELDSDREERLREAIRPGGK
jgi:tetratricopeptide (TPR) repeat protein